MFNFFKSKKPKKLSVAQRTALARKAEDAAKMREEFEKERYQTGAGNVQKKNKTPAPSLMQKSIARTEPQKSENVLSSGVFKTPEIKGRDDKKDIKIPVKKESKEEPPDLQID